MNRMWLIVPVLLLSSWMAAAQANLDTTVITILATVMDGQGRLVSNLTADDFELRADGKDQQLGSFTPTRNVPASIGIVLDISGSMENKIARATNAIEDFLPRLHRDDEVFVLGFSTEPRLVSDATDGRPELISKLRRLQTGGETAFYDAVEEALRRVRLGRYARRVLVVLTDGADSASSRTYQQVIRSIRESDVLIYCLGIPAGFGSAPFVPVSALAGQIVIQRPPRGGPQQPIPIPLPGGRTIPLPIPGNTPPFPPSSTPQPVDSGETVNMSVLEAIAEASGGEAWRVQDRQRRTGEPVDRILDQIAAELRNQYILGFVPSHPVRDGLWHDVRVRTRQLGYEVRARSDYFGRKDR